MVSHCRRGLEGLGGQQRGVAWRGETDAAREACLVNSQKSQERETGYAMNIDGTGVEEGRLLAWFPGDIMMAHTWRGHTGVGRRGIPAILVLSV